jgi:hypothetical protein
MSLGLANTRIGSGSAPKAIPSPVAPRPVFLVFSLFTAQCLRTRTGIRTPTTGGHD